MILMQGRKGARSFFGGRWPGLNLGREGGSFHGALSEYLGKKPKSRSPERTKKYGYGHQKQAGKNHQAMGKRDGGWEDDFGKKRENLRGLSLRALKSGED